MEQQFRGCSLDAELTSSVRHSRFRGNSRSVPTSSCCSVRVCRRRTFGCSDLQQHGTSLKAPSQCKLRSQGGSVKLDSELGPAGLCVDLALQRSRKTQRHFREKPSEGKITACRPLADGDGRSCLRSQEEHEMQNDPQRLAVQASALHVLNVGSFFQRNERALHHMRFDKWLARCFCLPAVTAKHFGVTGRKLGSPWVSRGVIHFCQEVAEAVSSRASLPQSLSDS